MACIPAEGTHESLPLNRGSSRFARLTAQRRMMARASAKVPDFLRGGGEMGALLRAHDWSQSSLGDPGGWPQALRTSVRLIPNTGHPMYIWWGPDGACLYNDAYRESNRTGTPSRLTWSTGSRGMGRDLGHHRAPN